MLPSRAGPVGTHAHLGRCFAIEEQAVRPRPGDRDPRYDPDRRAERLADQDVPLAREAGAEMFRDHGTRFDSPREWLSRLEAAQPLTRRW